MPPPVDPNLKLQTEQPFLKDLLEKLKDVVINPDLFVVGEVRWPKALGRPDVADMRRAFKPRVYAPQLIPDPPREPKLAYIVSQDMHLEMPTELAGDYRIGFSLALDDSPMRGTGGPALPYMVELAIDGAVPWIDAAGQRLNRALQVLGSPQYFVKAGRQELGTFRVI